MADVSNGAKSFASSDQPTSGSSQQEASLHRSFATSVLQGRAAGVSASAGRLLTVREVADRLRVCAATVYRLCESRELGHVRISNAVRVPETALWMFIESAKEM